MFFIYEKKTNQSYPLLFQVKIIIDRSVVQNWWMHFEEQLLAQVYSICSHCQATPAKILSWAAHSRGCPCYLAPVSQRSALDARACIALLPWALPVLTREQLGALQVLLSAGSWRTTPQELLAIFLGHFSPSLRARLNEKQVIPFLKEFINKV